MHQPAINPADYETLIYWLPHTHPEIASSSLHLYMTSRSTATVHGRVQFHSGLELCVKEVLDFGLCRISAYSYTVFYQGERIRWYDPQPHPENPTLAETFPHHRHEPPDIKHHRVPAPGLSFTSPNLSQLIADCLELEKNL